MMSVAMMSVDMMSVAMMSVNMTSVAMTSVVMLSVVALMVVIENATCYYNLTSRVSNLQQANFFCSKHFYNNRFNNISGLLCDQQKGSS